MKATRVCSIEGCDRPTKAHSWCRLHYEAARRAGTVPPRPTIQERFTSRVLPVESGCWEWQGRCNDDGYGLFAFHGTNRLAHRVSWILTHGEIPGADDETSGRVLVCHHCDNPPCVNPDHLFLGTDRDNMRDRSAKGRHWKQKVTHCPQGHAYDEANTGFDGKGRVCRTCHREQVKKHRKKRQREGAE